MLETVRKYAPSLMVTAVSHTARHGVRSASRQSAGHPVALSSTDRSHGRASRVVADHHSLLKTVDRVDYCRIPGEPDQSGRRKSRQPGEQTTSRARPWV